VFRHVKVERRVFDWSVKYLDVEAVSSNRLGSEADPVGAVIIVLYTRLYLISILVSDLGSDRIATKLLHHPVVVNGLELGPGLQVADHRLQAGPAQAGEGLAGLDAQITVSRLARQRLGKVLLVLTLPTFLSRFLICSV